MRMQTSTEQRRQKIDELERAFLQTVGESTSCGETTADEPGKATTDAGRPGAGAYADEAEKEAKFASMKSVIGIDIERETLQALLEAADGDEELALDVFFAESSRAAHRLVCMCGMHRVVGAPVCPLRYALIIMAALDRVSRVPWQMMQDSSWRVLDGLTKTWHYCWATGWMPNYLHPLRPNFRATLPVRWRLISSGRQSMPAALLCVRGKLQRMQRNTTRDPQVGGRRCIATFTISIGKKQTRVLVWNSRKPAAHSNIIW